ncbi:hypothetical protein Rcae01_01334 [Novipirellula caenicola]|uniref:Uncharacterized protein n=1 Tax=Novipirellula caenicola TaxID=1536901 RepID=A0ABP9VMR4_9BACT
MIDQVRKFLSLILDDVRCITQKLQIVEVLAILVANISSCGVNAIYQAFIGQSRVCHANRNHALPKFSRKRPIYELFPRRNLTTSEPVSDRSDIIVRHFSQASIDRFARFRRGTNR